MSSSNQQQQFRYNQTPSKVLHFRNLPWECSDEELADICSPFGKVINTKCNVGANRNQAFVEFADLNQAISMVSYYASSSEPAQVRGKTVYIQYSNRHEIVNSKAPGDIPGNVLLVTIEGVEAGDVSIDIIHLVFSAFGFVHKIATFEKTAGFQALIQYTDAETASSAKDSLDGRSIPRYLLPEHVGTCNLRISYSAHRDLNIKFQSNRSRDYTNPMLPVNQTAIDSALQPAIGPDGKRKEPESNVLLATIENMQYAVTVDVLHSVFSAFGTVQKVAMFEKNGQTHALIQYPDLTIAAAAKETLEGHCIYDGGYCKLHLTYSRHTDLNVQAFSDKSRDYTVLDPSLHATQAPALQNTQAATMYPGLQGQMPSWDPNQQEVTQSYLSAPGTFPSGQAVPPILSYSSAVAPPAGASPHSHMPPNSFAGASPPGSQPYYEWHALRDQPRYGSQVGNIGSGSSGSKRSHDSDACGSVGSSARPMGREAAKKKGKKKSKEDALEVVDNEWAEFKQFKEKELERLDKIALVQQEANQLMKERINAKKMKMYLKLSSEENLDDRKQKLLEMLSQELFGN